MEKIALSAKRKKTDQHSISRKKNLSEIKEKKDLFQTTLKEFIASRLTLQERFKAILQTQKEFDIQQNLESM